MNQALVISIMTASVASFTTFVAVPAHATIVVDLTGQSGTSVGSRSFTEGDLTVTFGPSLSSPQIVTASSAQGLCLFANSSDGTIRCGVSGTSEQPSEYNFLQLTSNRDIFLTGGSVNQILTALGGNSNSISITSSIGGSELASVPNTLGAFSTTPLFVSASQPLFFTGEGLNTATRLNNFTFEEVPGPLPVLGAAAAFGASRRIRKKIKQSI
jgi:hypothetical protein